MISDTAVDEKRDSASCQTIYRTLPLASLTADKPAHKPRTFRLPLSRFAGLCPCAENNLVGKNDRVWLGRRLAVMS